jgi:hypothetical protein
MNDDVRAHCVRPKWNGHICGDGTSAPRAALRAPDEILNRPTAIIPEGELSNQPGVPSPYGDYPEVFNAERHFPTGRVDDFQRSKVRLWTIYTLSLGKVGELDLTGPKEVQSGKCRVPSEVGSGK